MFDFRLKMSGNELVKKESKRRASWEEGIYEMRKLCLRNGKTASVPGIQRRSVWYKMNSYVQMELEDHVKVF